MPTSDALRGDAKLTALPSTLILPLVGANTPDSNLINVDFPAPLSPSKA